MSRSKKWRLEWAFFLGTAADSRFHRQILLSSYLYIAIAARGQSHIAAYAFCKHRIVGTVIFFFISLLKSSLYQSRFKPLRSLHIEQLSSV